MIIQEMFNVDSSLIQNDSGVSKGDIINWDSLGQLQLILKIEQDLKIKFKMSEIEEMKDFSNIMSVITKKLGQN